MTNLQQAATGIVAFFTTLWGGAFISSCLERHSTYTFPLMITCAIFMLGSALCTAVSIEELVKEKK